MSNGLGLKLSALSSIPDAAIFRGKKAMTFNGKSLLDVDKKPNGSIFNTRYDLGDGLSVNGDAYVGLDKKVTPSIGISKRGKDLQASARVNLKHKTAKLNASANVGLGFKVLANAMLSKNRKPAVNYGISKDLENGSISASYNPDRKHIGVNFVKKF